jgi:putative transposase
MRYRRVRVPGGTYFFTAVAHDRDDDLLIREIELLRRSFATVRRAHPFTIRAAVVLPDHLHMIWQMPSGETDFSTRWGLIKSCFSRAVADRGSGTRRGKRERQVWQRRFWEHLIRDDHDLARHVAYVHYNPVKHGLVETPLAWKHSSLHRYVRTGLIPSDWGARSRPSDGEFGE